MSRLVATCGFGLESVLAYEIRHLGFEEVEVHAGRIFFDADEYGIAIANIWLRTAERVYVLAAEPFPASTFDELFEGVRAIGWEDFIGRDGAFPVSGHSVKSRLTSVPACQKIIKKAVAVRLGSHFGTDILPESGTGYPVESILVILMPQP